MSLCTWTSRYNRAEIIRSLIWKIVGSRLPPEIQEKLSNTEEEYFKKHSAHLKEYMSKMELDLTVVISDTIDETLQ